MNDEKIKSAILTLEVLIDCCKEDGTTYNAIKEWEALEVFKQLQQERDKYKSIVEEIRAYIKTEKEKNLQLGTSTNDLEYRAYSLAMQVKLCEIEDKIKELEEGNSNEQ